MTVFQEFSDTDMNELVIREARITDADNIAFVEEDCFSTPWSRKSVAEAISHEPWHLFVADLDGKIVGYGGVYLILDEGQISNIAVLGSYRSKGIGKAILDAIIDLCKKEGCARITLELRKSNDAAHALYKKCGFVEVGERPNFYSNPIENAILMDKGL